MTLQTMPVDTAQLEFRFHGASEYRAYNKDTNKKDEHQARDEYTGYPLYTVRCQVLFRTERQSGMIAVRVPLPEPLKEDLEFEHPVTFGSVTSKTWNMEGERAKPGPQKPWACSKDSDSQPNHRLLPGRQPRSPQTQRNQQAVDRCPLSGGRGSIPRAAPMNNNSQDHKFAYSIEEAAELLSLKRDSLYELIHTEQLGSFKVGARRLIAHRRLEAFIESKVA